MFKHLFNLYLKEMAMAIYTNSNLYTECFFVYFRCLVSYRHALD